MIKLAQLSTIFENALNEILGDPNIKFKIWAEAGQFKRGYREGNNVTYYINGNLRTSTSANDANDLVMGVNGLSLEFAIPVQRPRTNATQTAEELQRIKDGQYPFVQEIFGIINEYFQTAKTTTITDGDGVNFSVSFQAGTSLSGTVDILPGLSECITASVYIEVYFIANGVNSKDVKVYFDNSTVPFIAVRHGRTPVVDADVYAGSLVSKNLITSSAFAIDVDFPVNSDELTKACISYLLSGEPNVAHFVKVVFGETAEKLYLMTLNTIQTSAQGISIAGVSASLMEVVENAEALNFPEDFVLGRFILENSDVQSISFTVSENCNAYIAGKASEMSGAQIVPVTPADMVYDAEALGHTDGYFVYLITDKAVEITNASATYEVVKGVLNG